MSGLPDPLDSRIQSLVAQAVSAEDPAELEEVVLQLRAALREYEEHLRETVAKSRKPIFSQTPGAA